MSFSLYVTVFRPQQHRSTTYVDAAYCYRPSSVVRRSVTLVSPVKMAVPIEMPFGLWSWMGKGTMCYMGVWIPPWERAILRGKGASNCKV